MGSKTHVGSGYKSRCVQVGTGAGRWVQVGGHRHRQVGTGRKWWASMDRLCAYRYVP
jgi:hypothetical protein